MINTTPHSLVLLPFLCIVQQQQKLFFDCSKSHLYFDRSLPLYFLATTPLSGILLHVYYFLEIKSLICRHEEHI